MKKNMITRPVELHRHRGISPGYTCGLDDAARRPLNSFSVLLFCFKVKDVVRY